MAPRAVLAPPQFGMEASQVEATEPAEPKTASERIAQSHAINDDFMANIQAKLNMLSSDI